MSFDSKNVNKIVVSGTNGLTVYAYPTIVKTVKGENNILQSLKKGSTAGRTSGDYFNMADGKFYKVNLYSAIRNHSYGYVKSTDFLTAIPEKTANTIADSNSDSLLQNLIKNDQALYNSILKNAIMIKQAQQRCRNVSKYENILNPIISAYNARQEKIKNSGLIKFKTGLDSTGKWLKGQYDKLISMFGSIGIAPVVIAIIFASGIVAAALIYYAFKPDYDTSKANLKSSELLEKALSSLTTNESNVLKKNLETQIDDAYNQGKTDQSFGGMFGNIKTILFIGLGGLLAFSLLKLNKRNGS